jgi:hypothetical protein
MRAIGGASCTRAWQQSRKQRMALALDLELQEAQTVREERLVG